MVFSSFIFLALFLPLTLGVYLLVPKRGKNLWLLVASLAFYAYGEPQLVFLFMVEIVWSWAFALGIERHRGTSRARALLICCLVLDLSMLAVFKYAALPFETANQLFGLTLYVPQIALPIGISFYTFQEISYIVDVYRGEKPQSNPFDVGLYLALFPQMIAGPIVRYSHIAPQLHNRAVTLEGTAEGFQRFCVGLCKKVLIANQLGGMVDLVFSDPGNVAYSGPLVWLAAIAFALQIFFDFSGYSDMAIGLGRMFGFKIPENFTDPYRSATATEFWRRWHISLSSWFRDYVYIPLGGSRNGNATTIRNLVIVWALTGLWHGAGWTFVFWGLGWGALIILEKFVVKPDERTRAARVAYRVFFLVCMLLLWVPFRCDAFPDAACMLAKMFSPEWWQLTAAQVGALAAFVHEEWLALLVGLGLSAGIHHAVARRLPTTGFAGEAFRALGVVALALLTVLSISFVVQGAYNPFLYFQF